MDLEQCPQTLGALAQVRPLTAICSMNHASLFRGILSVSAAVPEPFVIQPAIGIFRPPADWAGILGGGVCESAGSLWYSGCNHIDSPFVGCLCRDPNSDGIPTFLRF